MPRSSHGKRYISTETSSKNPWYLVPGDKYTTEKRLAKKYESDSKRKLENEKIDNYYHRWNNQTKLLDNWKQRKSLVKYYHSMENLSDKRNRSDRPLSSVLIPPFDTDDDDKQKRIRKKLYDDNFAKISSLFRKYYQSATEYKLNFIDTNFAVDYLLKQIEIYGNIIEKRQNFLRQWNYHVSNQQSSDSFTETINNYNYQSDPLRQICFAIYELLNYYKQIVDDNLKSLNLTAEKTESNDPMIKLFTKDEHLELCQLNDRCSQIIQIYLNLNDKRNHLFQCMYYEEREKHWPSQCLQWIDEINVWDSLFIELFNSNYQLIFNRINEFIQRQRKLLQNRLFNLEKLQQSIRVIKHDSCLLSILYLDIDKFL